ncbi:zinc-binding alcohol dehydrogenase [Acuticoccus sp. M5D2P5]|uniref:zinc-dependent alcohol dehydrogenase n=1 Tax=Acuticoccus kalidii TaxID=2910977 RepID=UPI001F2C4162|nr:zinc-binding alcohol dehydrogenase [Acuticoccus kalidii]MCF3932079.1 zinc-binding alcohol dehydrogenase [Acuticoccus kalidii]
MVRLSARYSAVSRGTERLVFEGRVPESEWERMRCPHQEGSFAFPVKYGYALVGRVTDGPSEWVGRTAFTLHPHQTEAVVGRDWITLVPDGVPPRRAALAANMETALNIVWDSGVSVGDRVLVVGAGVVGLLVARLLARIAGVEVSVADVNPTRAGVTTVMGALFCGIDEVPSDMDVAINTSGNDAGLRTALAAVGLEGRVVEASWHGANEARLPLGGAFHAKRLQIVSSQVGRIPSDRAARWTHRRRLDTVMRLLADRTLDALITHEVPFADAPARLPALLTAEPDALAILITYD